jgi:hypothetical protein
MPEPSLEFYKGWLQGFFDGEGGAYFSRYGARKSQVACDIRAANTDKVLIDFASKALTALGIEHKIYHARTPKPATSRNPEGVYITVKIQKRDATLKYIELVGFLSPRKIEACKVIVAWINRPDARKRRTV